MSRRDETIIVVDADGLEHTLPTMFAVCERCHGRGVHDCFPGGITADEWNDPAEWDAESREGYFAGDYDTTCSECGGRRVVPVVDEARMSPELLALWIEDCRDRAESRAIERAERLAGA